MDANKPRTIASTDPSEVVEPEVTPDNKPSPVAIDVDMLKAGLAKYFSASHFEDILEELRHKFTLSALLALVMDGIIVVERIVVDAGGLGYGGKGKQKKQMSIFRKLCLCGR